MSIFKKNKIGLLLGVTAITLSMTVAAMDRIPVRFIVAADSHSGSGKRASTSDLDDGINQLNTFYSDIDVEFYRDEIIYITNDDVDGINDDDWNTDNEEDVKPWFSYGKMNIIVASLDGLNGHAYWNYEGRDVIEIEPNKLDTSTIAHEVGHSLSLKHTYSGWDDETIAVMEGSSGYKYGDNIIDTPVDPGERSNFDDCEWIGSDEDSNGEEYDPDGFNIMGKGQNECRDKFSNAQNKRMKRIVQTHKFHLFDKYGSNQNPNCSNSPKVTSYPSREQFNYEDEVSDTPWVQDAFNDDEFSWKLDFDTSSSSTGANEPYEGQSFAHIDSSHEFLSDNDEIAMLSPCYDITNKDFAEVRFRYHMYGSDIGELTLEITEDNGLNWNELWSKSGEQHSSGNSSWSTATISLDHYLGKDVQLRLTGKVKGGGKGDISVDDIKFSASGDTGGNGSQTISIAIQSGSDDAEEMVSSGEVNLSSSDLELVEESGSSAKEQLVGLRFDNANIPADATIESATIQFTVDATNTGNTNLTIYGHYSGNSDTFSSSDDDISDRPLTSASVNWTPEVWDVIGRKSNNEKTPDLKSIVQELVNKSTWDTDSAVTFIISGEGEREAESYEGTEGGEAVLTITYSN